MARTVPESFVIAIGALSAMGDDEYDEFLKFFGDSTLLKSRQSLIDSVSTALPRGSSLPRIRLTSFIEALSRVAANPDAVAINEVLEDIFSADNINMDDDLLELTKQKAHEIVTSPVARELAMLLSAHESHSRPLASASIVADLRPVFNENKDLIALSYWQTLSLESVNDSDDDSRIEFSLDRSDLVKLKTQIETVLEEEETLRKSISQSGIKFWDNSAGKDGDEAR